MRKQSRLQGAWRGQGRGCWESWEQPVSSPHQGLVWCGRWQGAREGSRTGGTWLGGHLGRWTQREMGDLGSALPSALSWGVAGPCPRVAQVSGGFGGAPANLVYGLCGSRSGFPGGSEGKASACSAGDLGSIPGLGRSPGEGNGNLLWYSCLENPMDGENCRLQSMGSQRVGHESRCPISRK